MKFQNVQELIEQNKWTGHGPTVFDSRDNYVGANLSQYVQIVARNRDSDTLTESNFACVLTELGGEDDDAGVEIHRMGHWACGWYDMIMVRGDALDKLEIARDCLNRLDDYPVFNDDDYFERQNDNATEILENNACAFQKEFFKFLGFKQPDLMLRPSRMAKLMPILDAVYREDISYNGEDDAWVNHDSCKRWVESYDAKRYFGELTKTDILARVISARFQAE